MYTKIFLSKVTILKPQGINYFSSLLFSLIMRWNGFQNISQLSRKDRKINNLGFNWAKSDQIISARCTRCSSQLREVIVLAYVGIVTYIILPIMMYLNM